MSREVAKPISIIILKKGEEIVVSRETGEKIDQKLAHLERHAFLKIKEINQNIHTSEISRIKHTIERMATEDTGPELTELQQEKLEKTKAEIRKQLIKKGIVKPRPSKKEETSQFERPKDWPKNCRICNEKLPLNLKEFCSGDCIVIHKNRQKRTDEIPA